MEKTLEMERDELLREMKTEEKDAERRSGYVDGVLDMYNGAKRLEPKKEPVLAAGAL